MLKKLITVLALLILSSHLRTLALPNGVSGYTLKSGTFGCGTCHSTHGDPNASVIVTISGPTSLKTNQTGNFTVKIQGGAGSAVGTNIAASSGTLVNSDNNLKVQNGELTHPSPKSFSGGSYTFNFKYTAPSTPGSQTLYANGVSRKVEWNFASNFSVDVYDPTMSAPTNLTAIFDTLSRNKVSLNWSDNSNNELNFKIEKKTGTAGSFQLIGTVNADVNQYTDSAAFLDSTNYYYRVYAENADTFSTFSNSAQVFAKLPVELVSFSCIKDGRNVILNWITASEINNRGFEILRQIDDLSWEAIYSIEGNGTTTSTSFYEYVDVISEFSIAFRISYRLKQLDFNGEFSLSNIISVDGNQLPSEISLRQNYPNPFNPETQITFSVKKSRDVSLILYDLLGREVDSIFKGFKEAGTYNIKFNGNGLPSGSYYYKLTSAGSSVVKKMTLIK